jgi:hypothetical protein
MSWNNKEDIFIHVNMSRGSSPVHYMKVYRAVDGQLRSFLASQLDWG